MAKKNPTPRVPMTPDRPCGNTLTGGTLVQSLSFEKSRGRGKKRRTPAAAVKWARSHGYRAGKVIDTGETLHVRQFDPGYCEYRKLPFGKTGIQATIETPQRRPPKAHVIDAVEGELLRATLAPRKR